MNAMKMPKSSGKPTLSKGTKGSPASKPMKGAFGKMMKDTNLTKGNR